MTVHLSKDQVDRPSESALIEEYSSCRSCGAGLDKLVIGGVGTWRGTTLCPLCLHVERNLPEEKIIAPLLARQEGCTIDQALKGIQAAHEAHAESLKRLEA